MYRRFDIGWRDLGGNHGLIAAHDGMLDPREEVSLLQWTDLTRAPFMTHWFFVALTPHTMALIRVSPIGGGLRGSASYSHALLLSRHEISCGSDLGLLVQAIPKVPSRIGEPSNWAAPIAPVPPLNAQTAQHLASSPALLAAMFALPTQDALAECEAIPTEGWDQEQQIAVALRCYAVAPRALRSADLYFSTSDAPGYARPLFGFDARAAGGGHDPTLASYWLSVQGQVPGDVLEEIDHTRAEAVFFGVASWLTSDRGLDAHAAARDLVEILVAVPMHELDDAKFGAVEQVLGELPAPRKGPLLHALVLRLETTPVQGANPLWILRLLADQDALATLAAEDRRDVLRRLFEALPNELGKVLPGLPATMHSELVRALHHALRLGGKAMGPMPPPGLAALAERVLDASLMHAIDDGGTHDRRSAVLALNLMFDLVGRSGGAAALGQLAARTTRRIVTEPSVFAARMLDLVSHADTSEDKRTELLMLLLKASFDTGREAPVDGFVSALAAACGRGREAQRATAILDALQSALPPGDRLWIPLMREAMVSTAGRHPNGR